MTIELETRPAIDLVWIALFTIGIGLILLPVYILSTDGVVTGAAFTLLDTATIIALPIGILLLGMLVYNVRQQYEFTDEAILRHIPPMGMAPSLHERLPYDEITAVYYEKSRFNDNIGTIRIYTDDPEESSPKIILYRVVGFKAAKAQLEKHVPDTMTMTEMRAPVGSAAVLFFTRQA